MTNDRPQKITLAEMRAANVRGLLIYCSDYHCGHRTAISGDRWPSACAEGLTFFSECSPK
jgi:hypothetical protein